jgi:hypothetical protein
MFTHTTLSFSNMVGPTEQVLFCGNPIVYIAPGTYGHPHVSSSQVACFIQLLLQFMALLFRSSCLDVCVCVQALTIHYQSYMNKVKLVLSVDESQFPDCHQLLDDFAESLRLIREAAPRKPEAAHDGTRS